MLAGDSLQCSREWWCEHYPQPCDTVGDPSRSCWDWAEPWWKLAQGEHGNLIPARRWIVATRLILHNFALGLGLEPSTEPSSSLFFQGDGWVPPPLPLTSCHNDRKSHVGRKARLLFFLWHIGDCNRALIAYLILYVRIYFVLVRVEKIKSGLWPKWCIRSESFHPFALVCLIFLKISFYPGTFNYKNDQK